MSTGTPSASNGYINLFNQGRCTVTVSGGSIDIEAHDKPCQHYFRIEGISPENARIMSAHLLEAAAGAEKFAEGK